MNAYRHALLGIVLSSMAMIGGNQPAPARYLNPTVLPKTGSQQDFCPKGWTVESKISTDLNKDGKKDLVLILTENYARSNGKAAPTADRALIVLFRDAGKTYNLADYSTKSLLCTTCGGQLGATVQAAPKDGGFEVSQSGGGGTDGFEYGYTSLYDPALKHFHIVRLRNVNQYDRVGNLSKTEMYSAVTGKRSLSEDQPGGKTLPQKVSAPRALSLKDLDINIFQSADLTPDPDKKH